QAPTWLHQTLSSTTMTLSSLFIDAASGRPVILLGYSLRDAAGKPDGVLGIALSLSDLSRVESCLLVSGVLARIL
ncbi:MAG: PDC sensor domain-containing protein, partial [Gammaproteobacteria bacterium]